MSTIKPSSIIRITGAAIIASLLLFSQPAHAYQSVAHRGLFHDRNDNYNLAENSVDALFRAQTFGLPGAELDLRLSEDGQVLVFHDQIANRATTIDNDGGRLNPIDVSLNTQPVVGAININSMTAGFWNGKELKTYGRNGQIVRPDGVQKLDTLDAMLAHFKNLNSPTFRLYLDIQDPTILRISGTLVKKHQLDDKVFLKFFSTKAINSANYKYAGAATCHQYAQDNNLSGLQIVPQINDGELTIEGGKAFISVFQTKLTVSDYLSCWAAAQQGFGNTAARISMVSASVPYNNMVAYNAAKEALDWAKSHGRQTMSILPNPDAGRTISGSCRFWTFQSNNVKAALFDDNARKTKLAFAEIEKPDFVVVDLMGDLQTHTWTGDFSEYSSHLC